MQKLHTAKGIIGLEMGPAGLVLTTAWSRHSNKTVNHFIKITLIEQLYGNSSHLKFIKLLF